MRTKVSELIRLLLVILVPLLFNNCSVLKFQEFGHTPSKPGYYPVFTAHDSLSGHLDEYRAGYDVTCYNLNLRLDPEKHFLGGEVTINLRAVSNLKNLRFDIYRNFDIKRVSISGKDISFVRNGRAVTALLPDSLVTGNSYSLKVVYEGNPVTAKNPPWSGGFVWGKDKNGNPWVGVTCEKEGGSIWFPCKDHLSDEPDSVRLTMTVPQGFQVISNGILENHTSEPGTEKYTWSTNYPVNIYNITFYAGKYEHFSDTMDTGSGILTLDYYVLPENIQRAKEHFNQVKDIIKIYTASFGPYPWIREGFKLVESPYEGMEHQTAIAYGSGFINSRSLGGDYIIVHEAAHEWWGNAVSVSDFSDIWLQEGFATYSEMIFAERKMGYKSSLRYAGNYIAGMIKNKLPVVGPQNVGYWDSKDNDVYNKGAMILHTIRNVLNDSTLFFEILQTFYREHAALSHVTTTDFIEVVERKTGKDWDRFFDTYLNHREVPVLSWCSGNYNNDQVPGSSFRKGAPFLAAKWLNVAEGFSMPVTINCKDSGYSLIIDVSTEPSMFFLDPDVSCKSLIINNKMSYFDTIKDKRWQKKLKNNPNVHKVPCSGEYENDVTLFNSCVTF